MPMSTEAELQRQNERLELLLNLTSKITSSLEVREVLRAIAANIREVIHADAVVVSLPDAASGKSRVIAVDFPHGKGAVKEEVTVTLSPANKKAIDTLKPVVIPRGDARNSRPRHMKIVAAEGHKSHLPYSTCDRGRVLGTLSISRTTETPFVPEDIDFSAGRQGRSPSPLKTRWHTEKFPTQGQAGPGETFLERKFLGMPTRFSMAMAILP